VSADLTFGSATRVPVFDITTTMSKLLHLGVGLDDVVLRATATPTKIRGPEGLAGTLQPGANADIAILELRHEACGFRDSDGNTVTGKRRLVTHLTLKDGRVLFERQVPFGVPP
jgi:predicted amidohydrolase